MSLLHFHSSGLILSSFWIQSSFCIPRWRALASKTKSCKKTPMCGSPQWHVFNLWILQNVIAGRYGRTVLSPERLRLLPQKLSHIVPCQPWRNDPVISRHLQSLHLDPSSEHASTPKATMPQQQAFLLRSCISDSDYLGYTIICKKVSLQDELWPWSIDSDTNVQKTSGQAQHIHLIKI